MFSNFVSIYILPDIFAIWPKYHIGVEYQDLLMQQKKYSNADLLIELKRKFQRI